MPLPNDPRIVSNLFHNVQPNGILLTGGGDLSAYGAGDPERESVEQMLLDLAARFKIPLIGVCRGMQVLQHASGVRLHEVSGHVAVRHQLDGQERIVNSFHRYGANHVGPGWIETSRHGACVESMIHETLPWAAMMWHPERESSYRLDDVELFRGIFSSGFPQPI
ncbi:gamma-glutamyl-gamma-aminobutyrate hydrolase family protein [Austwickia sp. TVS 96-490-7B]|uniref:gamma-glutamyl-gamma-aminobutyrate hydrolase family protein n=1 Tax=Austwickia sp. TVS 96-490-7B TaxID=2830843 RepID=UPI001C58AC45